MLVLSRQQSESIVINNDIAITVIEIRGDKVRLGIEAPREASVHRREVWECIRQHQTQRPPSPPRPVEIAEPRVQG